MSTSEHANARRPTDARVDVTCESTDDVRASDRWAYWKDTAMAPVDGKRLVPDGPFSARRLMGRLTSGILVDTESGPVSCRRPSARIARDGDDDVCLVSLSRGHGVADQRGVGEVALGTGDLTLFDCARPYAFRVVEPYRESRLYVPRATFAERVGPIDDLVGLRVAADDPLAVLLRTYLAGLTAALPTMTRDDADAGLDGALHLLRTLVAARADVRAADGAEPSGDGFRQIVDHHVVALMSDPELDVARLARAVGVSRARLYRALSGRGGVAAVIREARLVRAGRRLTDPADGHRTIDEVARACGFKDASSFSRSFRERFGASPRDWRAKG